MRVNYMIIYNFCYNGPTYKLISVLASTKDKQQPQKWCFEICLPETKNMKNYVYYTVRFVHIINS
jgi:hypothetical protein